MASALVQSVTNLDTAGPTVVTTINGVANGNKLVVAFSVQAAFGAGATPVSNTGAATLTWRTAKTSLINEFIGIYEADATATGNYTITCTAAAAVAITAYVREYSGVVTGAVDASGSAGSSSASPAATSGTLAQAGEMVVCAHSFDTGVLTSDVATNSLVNLQVTLDGNTDAGCGVGDKSASVTTAQTGGFTMSASHFWDCVIVTIKDSASGTPSTPPRGIVTSPAYRGG